MWLPYHTSGSLKAETDAETIRLSRLDPAPRTFLVGFFLRNPVTQAWEADLRAEAAGTTLACELGGAPAEVGFYGNDAGKLGEVLYRLTATDPKEALRLAHEDLERRLAGFVIDTGRGMDIVGWRVADMTHGARWRCTPFRPSALAISFADAATVPDDLRPLAALYKRTRNAPDASYRLLCAYAILAEGANPEGPISAEVRESFTVTQELLIHSGAMEYATLLAGKSLGELVEFLRPEQDALLAGSGRLRALVLDQAAEQRLGLIANLADFAAHKLLGAEMRHREAAGLERSLQPTG